MSDAQPPADEIGLEKTSPPGLFVLIGCSGDLAARKIAPALYTLFASGLLPEELAVLGTSRRDWDDETLRQQMAQAIEQHSRTGLDRDTWERFAKRWHYQKVQIDEPDDYAALAERLNELDDRYDARGNRLFYLAMEPRFFAGIADRLANVGLNRQGDGEGYSRIVVEKPFGYDLPSARELNEQLGESFEESQIYRIDHYLGKETVQNILVFRFANAMFDPHLNHQWVQSVEITTAETVGMEGRRGPYYNQTGALRDMMQNHMLQLLSLVAMDRPDCLRCESLRDAKLRLLQSIRPMSPADIARHSVRGQYTAAEESPGYLQEEGVAEDSQTETFAAVRLTIDNLRWRNVPFYLRTGKRLAEKTSQIVVTFQREPRSLFDKASCDMQGPNRLWLRITPREGISLGFDAKVPGPGMLLRPVRMDFTYDSAFASASPEAYEHLLLDALRGEAMLFLRNDEIEAAWAIVDPIRQCWDAGLDRGLQSYEPGSWGPAAAEDIFDDPYQRWSPL